jgi:hypothetical protein
VGVSVAFPDLIRQQRLPPSTPRVHHLDMRKLSWLLLAAFFFLNPGFACGPMEPEFQYGATEMRAAIEGNWAVTVTPTGGAAQDYVVTLKQAKAAPTSASRGSTVAFVRSAHACGDRTLLASANACASKTVMPLTATLASGGASPSASYEVWSLIFTQGDLFLTLGDHSIQATVAADGSVLDAKLAAPGGSAPAGTVTLRRLP